MLTNLFPLAVSDLATVESITTLLLYIAMGAGWAYVGYRRNRAARGEIWQSRKALSTFAAGGIVGLVIVLSGQEFNSSYVIALSGFIVPLIDKLWNAATMATDTATDMARDGESIPEIALEVAQIIDREVAVGDVMSVIAEYERRFGPLEPDMKNVEKRADELKEEYNKDPDKVYDRFGPEEAVEDEETGSDPTVASRPKERSYIVEGPVVGPESDPDGDPGGGSGGGGGDGDRDDNSDGTIHESA